MKCLNCGNENPNNSTFCSSCGTRLQSVTNNNQLNSTNNSTSNSNSSKKTIIIIVAIIGGILALGGMIFGGIYLFMQYKLQQADKQVQDWAENIGDLDSIEIPGNKDNNTNKVEEYNIGELVTLVDGSTWYVMNQDDKSITLLSTENYGEETYFSNSKNYYNESIVKGIIENDFLPKLKNSISSKGGNTTSLTARIISVDDIREILNVSSSVANTDIEIGSSHRWLFETGSYWTNGHSENDIYESVYIVESWGMSAYISEDVAGLGLSSGNKFNVRPVIETTIDNLK